MRNGAHEAERRDGQERRSEERRKQAIPVAVERRSGGDRRVLAERRAEATARAR
jgi:hypothetical protein